ncbi:MAG: hypothetical protein SVW77_01545 [Candidatus Nanohaloarchaea archaeon]|nr:hypothetical protein [Candidatus Nanohaloarchaea archaeon]
MDTRTLFLISVVAAVGLAGCTALPGQGGGDDEADTRFRITQNDGLTVSFSTTQSRYFEDGEIVLDLELQNTGQSTAENVQARLFGASFLAGNTVSLTQSTLEGVDQAAQQAGQIATGTYQQSNPVNLRQGEVRSFPVGVRVMYDYTTSSSASFRVLPREDFTGGSELVTTENTAAPVKADIQVQSPKPVSSAGNGTVTVSVPIQVRNVGGGQVVQNIQGERGPVQLTASFPLAGGGTASITDCGGSGSNTKSFRFPRGQTERRVVCTAEISSNVFDTQLSLEVDLDYTYFETPETTFRIEGMSGDQT